MKTSDALSLVVLAAACALGLDQTFGGAAGPPPAAGSVEALAPHTLQRGLSAERQAKFAAALGSQFGSWDQPRLPRLEKGDALLLGAQAYPSKCGHCHGGTGTANTSTARMLMPKPRDFSRGVIKFTSTPAGEPPTLDDLQRLIRDGVPTTAMAGFGALPAEEIDALARYTRWLLLRGAVESEVGAALADDPQLEPAKAVAAAYRIQRLEWLRPAKGETPTALADHVTDSEAIARGEELYASPRAGCVACHGPQGDGDGPASVHPQTGEPIQRDLWGAPIRLRPLRDGRWHGGNKPEELYLRIAEGVQGTPMPPRRNDLSSAEISDLVAWLLSLKEGDRK